MKTIKSFSLLSAMTSLALFSACGDSGTQQSDKGAGADQNSQPSLVVTVSPTAEITSPVPSSEGIGPLPTAGPTPSGQVSVTATPSSTNSLFPSITGTPTTEITLIPSVIHSPTMSPTPTGTPSSAVLEFVSDLQSAAELYISPNTKAFTMLSGMDAELNRLSSDPVFELELEAVKGLLAGLGNFLALEVENIYDASGFKNYQATQMTKWNKVDGPQLSSGIMHLNVRNRNWSGEPRREGELRIEGATYSHLGVTAKLDAVILLPEHNYLFANVIELGDDELGADDTVAAIPFRIRTLALSTNQNSLAVNLGQTDLFLRNLIIEQANLEDPSTIDAKALSNPFRYEFELNLGDLSIDLGGLSLAVEGMELSAKNHSFSQVLATEYNSTAVNEVFTGLTEPLDCQANLLCLAGDVTYTTSGQISLTVLDAEPYQLTLHNAEARVSAAASEVVLASGNELAGELMVAASAQLKGEDNLQLWLTSARADLLDHPLTYRLEGQVRTRSLPARMNALDVNFQLDEQELEIRSNIYSLVKLRSDYYRAEFAEDDEVQGLLFDTGVAVVNGVEVAVIDRTHASNVERLISGLRQSVASLLSVFK